jgi:uncharacterized protein (TIGR03435 family)
LFTRFRAPESDPIENNHMTRLLASSVFLLVVIWGCQNKQRPQQAILPPIGVELCSLPGVSIIRCPDKNADSGHAITSDRDKGDATKLEAKNAKLFDVFCFLCPFENGPIYNDAPLPEGAYNITLACGKDGETAWPRLKEAFEKTFHVRVRQFKRLEDVHVLKRDTGKSLRLLTTPDKGKNWGTAQTPDGFGYKFRCATMEDLAEILEKFTNTTVLNETALEGTYAFELSMDCWKPQTVFSGIEKLGLRLTKEKREMDTLHIEAHKE